LPACLPPFRAVFFHVRKCKEGWTNRLLLCYFAFMDPKRSARIFLGKLEDKDSLTAEHSRNVARLSLKLGKALRLRKKELRDLEMGALLHDVDKLAVPDHLFEKLRKGTPLDREECLSLHEHDQHWQEDDPLLADMPQVVQDCQRLHHENYDGTGVPMGLRGSKIPLPVRIIQVADTYDALTLNFPARPGMKKEEALRSLQDLSGAVLDPELVDRFVQLMK